MTLSDWSDISQIVMAFFTFVGVLTSLTLSIRAIRELQVDRRLRQAPHMVFEPHAFRVPVEFVKSGRRIPGKNPDYVEKGFADLPADAESIRPKHKLHKDGSITFIGYGILKNYGLGTSLDTKISWIPKEICIGSQTFSIDDHKLSEPRYSKGLNTMLPNLRHILPGQEAELNWLPTFIEKDTDKIIQEVIGIIEIRCTDVYNQPYETLQKFRIFTGYSNEEPYVHVVFSSIYYDID